MSNVWYTSDLHFYHEKVAKLRGFPNSLTHDQVLAQNWRANVKGDDTVYVLGDIASDERFTEDSLDVIDHLPGQKILIAGNHDPFHPRHRKFTEWHQRIGAYTTILATAPFARRKLLGQDVWLSHFPYIRDRGESRNMQDRLRNEGNWLLHGHTHGTEKVTIQYGQYNLNGQAELVGIPQPYSDMNLSYLAKLHSEFPGNVFREIHVGLDAWNMNLVPQDTIIDLIKAHTKEV